jgi:integrase
MNYIDANTRSLSNTQRIEGTKLLRNFTFALSTGTIDLRGEDISGLYWGAMSPENVRVTLSHITQYTDFYSEKSHNQLPINPLRKASHIEEKMNWCAYYHRQQGVFLSHLDNKKTDVERIKHVRTVQSDQPDFIENEKVVRFPENKINALMNYGFVKCGSTYPDYKNQLITMLMHYGGLRLSEVFHIYINDIVFDKKHKEALVRVFHPSRGQSPIEPKQTRRSYLMENYGLKPRNEYPKSIRLHAGWKTPLLTSNKKYFEVIFSNPNIAKTFWNIWVKYLTYQRKNPPLNFQHPFAFTNSKGKPETIKNFRRMHDNAVIKIGLNPSKDEGTSSHSHRHSYGYTLSELGFIQVEIQKAMHHKSPKSCLVYIQPTSDDIRSKMRITESSIIKGVGDNE